MLREGVTALKQYKDAPGVYAACMAGGNLSCIIQLSLFIVYKWIRKAVLWHFLYIVSISDGRGCICGYRYFDIRGCGYLKSHPRGCECGYIVKKKIQYKLQSMCLFHGRDGTIVPSI